MAVFWYRSNAYCQTKPNLLSKVVDGEDGCRLCIRAVKLLANKPENVHELFKTKFCHKSVGLNKSTTVSG